MFTRQKRAGRTSARGGQATVETRGANRKSSPAGSANARQRYQHYIALAEAAEKSGDRVSSESFYQYADHYYRVLRWGEAGEMNPA